MNFKEQVYEHCRQLINKKISLLSRTLEELKESSSNETKSTAGDKHETALAMLQIEQENTGRQLKEAREQQLLFGKIDITVKTSYVIQGSLIKTNRGWLFLSVALGRIKLDDGITAIALSPQSPLGKQLLGLHVRDAADVNNIQYIVEYIV